jgi:hypothetical protein
MVVLDDHVLMVEQTESTQGVALAALTGDSALHLPDS